MIIGNATSYAAAAFIEGLRKAARGVLRVTVETSKVWTTTAWLITDTLLVMPDYTVDNHSNPSSSYRYLCYPSPGKSQSIEADLITELSTDGARPALLRLREPLPERTLTLKFESLVKDEYLFVLHYPHGKPQTELSIGRMIGAEGTWIDHDASTLPGSGGAPILAPIHNGKDFAVAGMHVKSSVNARSNQALSLAAILHALRESAAWDEIAICHNLADVTAAQQQLKKGGSGGLEQAVVSRDDTEKGTVVADASLLPAAVYWNFDKKMFTPDERKRLKSLVVDPSAERWALRTPERQRLIRSAGSLDELRKARGNEETTDPAQRTVDRILQGPPFSLEDVDEASLPYWLQAVRWFADVMPSLPTPAQVNRALQRRRVRSSLQSIAGPGFRGRAKELAEMRAWYQEERAGPLVITGIGGVGKSALVARFASELLDKTLLLLLDFDRADLAPDDAVSVLRLLFEQASVQLEGFTAPEVDDSSWEKGADEFALALAQKLGEGSSPLLVLDGFEVAQHVEKHQEIWKVLGLILDRVPELRVIVSGRAQVKGLELRGRKVHSLPLIGMAREDAEGWLREHGIVDANVLERVLDISNGVPLVLKLAVRWVETGGKVSDLPSELPKALVEGFLYQRILDRVIDPLLKPIARDALVLRWLTQEMIPEVLSDSVPEGLDAGEVFSRLAQEMSLVGGDEADAQASSITVEGTAGVLRLRPGVRSATLRLLEMDNDARVRMIDERAATWYAKQPAEVSNLAELVYHRLRLGDIEGAAQAWTDECDRLLLFAEEDLKENAHEERAWLQAHLGEAASASGSLEAWEKEATIRIREALGRGLLRAVPAVLNEREQRSPSSPLVIYDAWTRWHSGDHEAARDVLKAASEAQGAVGRDRAVLGAMLAAQADDRPEADRLLAEVDNEERWSDRHNGKMEALAVRASRVRLTVNLKAELKLLDIIRGELGDGDWIDGMKKILTTWDDDDLIDRLKKFLRSSDLMLPGLCRLMGEKWIYEVSRPSISIPVEEHQLESFAHELHQYRRSTLLTDEQFRPSLDDDTNTLYFEGPAQASDFEQDVRVVELLEKADERLAKLGIDLAIMGWRRWRLATTSLLLARSCELALQTDRPGGPLGLSIVGTLAAFRGQEVSYESFETVDQVIGAALRMSQQIIAPAPPADRAALAREIVYREEKEERNSGTHYKLIKEFRKLISRLLVDSNDTTPGTERSRSFLIAEYFPAEHFLEELELTGLHSVILYLLGPDPLETLCGRVLGLPDNLNS